MGSKGKADLSGSNIEEEFAVRPGAGLKKQKSASEIRHGDEKEKKVINKEKNKDDDDKASKWKNSFQTRSVMSFENKIKEEWEEKRYEPCLTFK